MTAHLTSLPCDQDIDATEPCWPLSEVFSRVQVDATTPMHAEWLTDPVSGADYLHVTITPAHGGALHLDMSLGGMSALGRAMTAANVAKA